jgi:hypothetical protein
MLLNLNPTLEAILIIGMEKKNEGILEINQVFQDNWAVKLPWLEVVLGFNGKMHFIKCRMCTHIKGR